jgi:segregation and condensation protein B
MEDLKNIIESLLFVAEEPLSAERLKKLVGPVEGSEIHAALAALRAELDSRRGGFYLSEVAGGFQFRTRPEYTPWIRRLIDPKPVRLSRAALETLAIIAYKQPIIRTDVEHIRGVDCGGVLRQLLERKLVRVLGRKEIPGRPLIYATTKKFLETFDLKDLRDLPTPQEVAEFGKPPLEERGHITIEPEEEAQPTEETGSVAPEPPLTADEAATPADTTLLEEPEISSGIAASHAERTDTSLDAEQASQDKTIPAEADKTQESV